MDKNLKEIIALPVGLKPVIKFDNDILYGSDRLNKSFIKALSKGSQTKGSVKTIEKLIRNKTIIPCFLSKSFRGFIAWRIFKSKPINIKTFDFDFDSQGNLVVGKEITITINPLKAAHSIMGFYSANNKKIIIILSNNLNIFSYVSNSFLSQLTLHELIHMIALQKQSKFISIFNKDLVLYYSYLWSIIFKLQKDKIKEKDLRIIISFLFKLEKQESMISNSDLTKYYKLMENLKKYSNLNDKDFTKILVDYIVTIKFFIKNINIFFSHIQKFNHIIGPIYLTYKKVFGLKKLTSMCIQELIFPSEIIAIWSEKAHHQNLMQL